MPRNRIRTHVLEVGTDTKPSLHADAYWPNIRYVGTPRPGTKKGQRNPVRNWTVLDKNIPLYNGRSFESLREAIDAVQNPQIPEAIPNDPPISEPAPGLTPKADPLVTFACPACSARIVGLFGRG